MAVVTTFLDNSQAQVSRQVTAQRQARTLPATGIANGDNVQLHTFPAGRLVLISEVIVTASGSLGASATVKAQINRNGTRTDLSTATTAGARSQGSSYTVVDVPFVAQGGDVLELLVGGANISASADVTVDYQASVR